MRELPILFSTPMVQAILDGRKTQTRRVIKDKDITNNFDIDVDGSVYAYIDQATGDSYPPTAIAKYQVGDILWVRETWRDRWGMAYANYGTGNAYPIDDVREVEYKAGGNGFFMHGCNLCPDEPTVKWGEWSKWRPSIYMPRDAARIFLRVTNVRVERLQDILCGDMKREGCIPDTVVGGQYQQWQRDYWVPLWDSVNKKRGYGWDSNPWVWVIEFKKVTPCP